MVGMIWTQYSRQFLVCPRAISTQFVPATVMGTEAMARRTVSGLGPSDALQVSGRAAGGGDAFEPQPQASKISRITVSRRTRAA